MKTIRQHNPIVKPTIGPRMSAARHFQVWYELNKHSFRCMSAKEVASLAFDAGHAFHHEDVRLLKKNLRQARARLKQLENQ